MGSPSIYVYDCNNAGIIVDSFKNFAEQHEREYVEKVRAGGPQAGAAELPPPPSHQELYPAGCLLQGPAAAHES